MERRHIAIGLLILSAAALAGLRMYAQPQPTSPARLAVGEQAPAAVSHVLGRVLEEREFTERDIVFVARDCVACRALITSLQRTGREPPPHRAVVIVTDTTWPELDAIRSARIAVVADGGRAARAGGVRATPTLATLDDASTVRDVGVGVASAFDRFTKERPDS